MRFKPVLLSLVLSSAACLPAWAAESSARNVTLDSQLFYQLLLGELSAQSNDPGTGFALILDAARKTQDEALYQRAVDIALRARSGTSALQAAKAWSQVYPDSADANRYVLNILLGLNRTAEALEPLKRALVLAAANERQDTLLSIPTAFANVSDNRLAAATVHKALTGWLQDRELGPTAWAVIGRMWLKAGDRSAALNAAEKGLALDDRSEHAAMLALSLLGPETPQAEALVKSYLPHAQPDYRMAYAKALLGAQRQNDAQLELQSLSLNFPDYADVWLIRGLLELASPSVESATRHLMHYLSLVEAEAPSDAHQRGRSQALFALAHIAQQQNNLTQADQWLQRINNPDDVLQAQVRRANLLAMQGQIDAALALIDSQPERNASEARLKRSAQVQLLREQHLFERARELLETAVAQNPDDLDWLYDLAMVHERLGQLDDMERLLRQLIERKPDDPQAYNALGYSLSDRNLRLTQARQLIEQALQLAPNDPFITDSLGWVEYRSGNKDEALRLLQIAFRSRPDAEIAAHLGEVLWTLARRPEAIEVFKQGLQLNPANDTLNSTIQRLHVPL